MVEVCLRYVYIYKYTCVYLFIYLCIYLFVCRICIYIYTHIYIYTCVRLSTWIYVVYASCCNPCCKKSLNTCEHHVLGGLKSRLDIGQHTGGKLAQRQPQKTSAGQLQRMGIWMVTACFFTSTKTLDTFGHTSIWILFCKKEGSCATFEPLGPCASHSIWGTQRRRCWSMTRAPVLWNGRHSTPEKIRKSEKIWNRPQKIWGGNIETPSNLLTSLSFSFWSSLCSIEVLHELSGHLRSWYLSRSSLEKSGCLNCGVSGLIHPRYWGKSWLCWYHQHAL